MGALDGIRVLDFSRLAPGPYCSMLLADMGADVVRVDKSPEVFPREMDVVGRGKRSIALDLKKCEAVEVALRLASQANVVLEGFRPGVMERLGLGPRETMAVNPKLVYARLTGWGQDGPLAQAVGHDINYIAVAGVLSAFGRSGEPPVPPVNLIGDFAGGGLMCAFGIVCALLSGKAQVIDSAMVDGAANLFAFFAGPVHHGIWHSRGENMLDTGAHFYDVYETSDKKFMSVGAIEPKFYAALLEGLGIEPNAAGRQMDAAHDAEMRARFTKIFATRSRQKWTEIFRDKDACVFPVLDPSEAAGWPDNVARNTHFEGAFGVVQPTPAPRLSATPGSVKKPPPKAGEHTAEILAETGYGASEIEALIASGAASEA